MYETLFGSILSALATGVGALPIIFMKNISHRWRDILLAFAAGIMVATSTFSLIPTALNTGGLVSVSIGVLLGVLMLDMLEKNMPHIHVEDTNKKVEIDSKALLIITAITLHNIPEGLSVGVSYASSDGSLGGLVALAIGLQNAPEGLLVALFLVNQNVGRFKSFLIATLTGMIEILTGIIGFQLVSYVSNLIPYGLSFAAGAMLFIVYKELIPESHGHGYERSSTYSFIFGLLIMIWLTTIFR